MLRALGKTTVFSIDLRGDMEMAQWSLVNCAWNPQLMFLSGQQICLFVLCLALCIKPICWVTQPLSVVVTKMTKIWPKCHFRGFSVFHGSCCYLLRVNLLLLLSNVAKWRWRQGKRQHSSLKLNFPPQCGLSWPPKNKFNCELNGTQIKHLWYILESQSNLKCPW